MQDFHCSEAATTMMTMEEPKLGKSCNNLEDSDSISVTGG